jgi:phage regulator Rha-like protein
MNELIKIEIVEGSQVIDSRIVAEGLGVKHKTLLETIRKYQTELESISLLPFETAAVSEEGSRGTKYITFCYLNELQCHFIATLSRNTSQVVAFKLGLVKAFHTAKQEIEFLKEVIEESEDVLSKKRKIYKKQGYSDNWIEKRLESMEVRNELEALWRTRGIDNPRYFAILTSIISKETFGISPTQHKKIKGLKNQNLRDHMTNTELAFITLAEAATTEISEADNAQTYQELKQSSKKGGNIAKEARKMLEAKTGKNIVSSLNFLPKNRDKYLKK